MFMMRHVFGLLLVCGVAVFGLAGAGPAAAADLAAGKVCGQAPATLSDATKLAAMDAACASKTCAPGPSLKGDVARDWYCLAEKKNCAWPDGDGFVDGDLKFSVADRKLLRCVPAKSAGGRAYFTEVPR